MNKQTRDELIELAKRAGATEITFCSGAEIDKDDFDHDFGGDFDDDGLSIEECGQEPDGSCSRAGSEQCEFDCPFRS